MIHDYFLILLKFYILHNILAFYFFFNIAHYGNYYDFTNILNDIRNFEHACIYLHTYTYAYTHVHTSYTCTYTSKNIIIFDKKLKITIFDHRE